MRRKATPDPYAGFETRIAPENITLLPKTTAQTTGGNDWNERIVTLKKGDSVATVLRDLGAKPEEIKAIVATLGPRGRDGGVKEGQKLRVLLTPAADGKRMQPVRVVVAGDTSIDAIVALSDHRQIRCGRRAQHGHRGGAGRRTKRRTTARACGSTRASTRPRCATRCRAR